MAKILYIDMDNVLVDFPSAFPQISAESRTTIGEIIEALVARHLDKEMPAITRAIEQARE